MKLPDFIRINVSLASHSTLGVGGPADYFAVINNDQTVSKQPYGVEAKFIQAYEFARDNKLEVFILGQGSNMLFSDKGFRGLILKINADDIWFTDADNEKELWADAGAPIAKLVDFAKINGLSGFEFLAGLPGTVGGAVYGNAGCYDGEFWDV
ncbi:MAG: FAD-binding protein, partial [Patescibacteria group bacterium]